MKIKWFLFIFALSCANLFGGVENYLRKITNKEASYLHPMKNIDFIYIINLDQRPQKFASCIDQLRPYGINPFRFSAVNGWELSLETINDIGVKYQPGMTQGWGTCYLPKGDFQPHHEIVNVVGRNYFCHCMSRGAIGIVLSHLSIIKDAYDAGYETIWVMEDDIQVIKNPHRISKEIERLDKYVGKGNWDILFTDQDTKNQKGEYVPCTAYAWRPNFNPKNPARFTVRQDIKNRFRKVGGRYGAYSMIVRRSGMEKILNFYKTYQVFLPYDMDFNQPNDINLYSVIDDIVSTQPTALSDNGGPNYKNPQ